jgi:hypothetical protein
MRWSSLVLLLVATSVKAAEVRFIAHTTDAVLPAAQVLGLDDDGKLQLSESAGSVAVGKLIELRQAGRLRPAWPRQHFVSLTHGDCVLLQPGAPVRLVDGRLHALRSVKLPTVEGAELSMYRPYVTMFFNVLPDGVEDPDLFLAQLRQETRLRDVVLARNGDRVEGTVTALDAEHGCEVTEERRKIVVPWHRLAGIAWNTQRASRPRPRQPLAHVVLEGGARLNCAQLRFQPELQRWLGKTWFGATFEFAVDRLCAVDIWHGAAVFLSDLPGKYQAQPFTGVDWPLTLDTALSGRPIALADGFFDKGIGMHAASKVSYALAGEYRWFEATVGLDERAGGLGRARLAVLLDGERRELSDKKEWRARDGSLAVRLDVRGVRELTLLVEYGSLGDVQAQVSWANARLVK